MVSFRFSAARRLKPPTINPGDRPDRFPPLDPSGLGRRLQLLLFAAIAGNAFHVAIAVVFPNPLVPHSRRHMSVIGFRVLRRHASYRICQYPQPPPPDCAGF